MFSKVFLGLSIFLSLTIFPKNAEAIIFLPALILIPIAKIVALIIAGLSLPSLGAGVLWKSLFGGSLRRILLMVIIFLFILGVAVTIFLYFENPNRPFF